MIGIKKDRCGYSGYVCKGLDSLDDVFRTTKLVCDTQQSRTSGFESPSGNKIDNYLNLPTSIAGFGTLVDVIKDMRLKWSSGCFSDKEIASVRLLGRFLDRVVYRSENFSSYTLFRDALTCFENARMYPGLLEPIQDYGDKNIPASFPSIDSGAFVVKYLAGILNALKDYLPTPVPEIDMCGIPGLIGAIANTSSCKLLRIELASGTPLVYGDGTEELPVCTYRVTGGVVTINGVDVPVADKIFKAPFTVYANLRKADYGWYADLSTTKDTSEGGSVYVGSVKVVDTSDKTSTAGSISDDICEDESADGVSGSTKYKMYAIEQATCVEDVTVPDTGLPGLLMEMANTSPCPDFKVSWISGETHKAGDGDMPECLYSVGGATINLNGEPVKVSGIESIAAPFYIYLNTSEDGKSAELSTQKGENATAIGGVSLVDSKDSGEPGERHRMYVISQDDCYSSPVVPWEETDLCGVENLIVGSLGANTLADCNSLSIQYVSGPLKLSWKFDEEEPDFTEPTYYKIPGGDIEVNGKAVPVDSAMFSAPFHAYLNPKKDENGLLTGYGVSTTKEAGGVSIGRVSLVRSDAEVVEGDTPAECRADVYKAWKISQDTCDSDMNLTQTMPIVHLENIPKISSIAINAAEAATCGILDIFAMQNIESPCPTAKIRLYKGCPVCELEEGRELSWDCDPVYYTVSGFIMRVNGQAVEVPSTVNGSEEPVEAPFDLYLNMYKQQDGTTTASMTTAPDEKADSVKNLGGVKLISTVDAEEDQKASTGRCETVKEEDKEKPVPVVHRYAVMQIAMADCPEDYELPEIADIGALENIFLAQAPNDECPHITITKVSGTDIVHWKPNQEEEPAISAYYKVDVSGKFSGIGSGIPFELDETTVHKGESIAAPFYVYARPVYSKGTTISKYVATVRKGVEPTKPVSYSWIYAGKVGLLRTSDASKYGGMYKAFKVETIPCLENQISMVLSSAGESSFYDTSESGCQNFHISRTGGRGFWEKGGFDDSTYSIGGGNVSVNGELIHVAGISGVKAPFSAYIKFSAGTGDNGTVTAKLYTGSGGNNGADTVLVGGVSRVDGSSTNSKYGYNKIECYSCDVATDMIRTKSGFVFKKSSSGSSGGSSGSGGSGGSGSSSNPYKAYSPTACET